MWNSVYGRWCLFTWERTFGKKNANVTSKLSERILGSLYVDLLGSRVVNQVGSGDFDHDESTIVKDG